MDSAVADHLLREDRVWNLFQRHDDAVERRLQDE
jgi:hypothetical protein